MKALSVRPPWAWAIVHLGKDVENRTWMTRYRGPLLIHASRNWDQAGAARIKAIGGDFDEFQVYRSRGGVIGQVDLVDCVRNHRSPWAEPGLVHLVLANARPLPFFPCRGRLGLFEVNYPNLEKKNA